MSIILSDFIDENNIELSSKEIRFALKKIYNIEEEYNYHKVLEDFYKISEKLKWKRLGKSTMRIMNEDPNVNRNENKKDH